MEAAASGGDLDEGLHGWYERDDAFDGVAAIEGQAPGEIRYRIRARGDRERTRLLADLAASSLDSLLPGDQEGVSVIGDFIWVCAEDRAWALHSPGVGQLSLDRVADELGAIFDLVGRVASEDDGSQIRDEILDLLAEGLLDHEQVTLLLVQGAQASGVWAEDILAGLRTEDAVGLGRRRLYALLYGGTGAADTDSLGQRLAGPAERHGLQVVAVNGDRATRPERILELAEGALSDRAAGQPQVRFLNI